MKILLIGEYSNVHATLAEGLRQLGHVVTVVSNGDFWKDYPRDISLVRRPGKIGGIMLWIKLQAILPRLKGYDVVQLINPMFIELKAERLFSVYDYLRKHNKRVFLGGYGMDWYWVNGCLNKRLLRYSDFNIGDKIRTNADALKERKDWIGTEKERLNKYIANDCDGIITGLYEYWVCYNMYFPDKTSFVPFPIRMPDNQTENDSQQSTDSHHFPIRIFIGISKGRSEYKGTDIMLRAAKAIESKYPEKVSLYIAEGMPFSKYQSMMNDSDVILDQLYSYTPAMNALLAMSKGIVCVGGGEPENYEILKEDNLRPIVNVLPNYDSVYLEIENIVLHPELIDRLKRQSTEYVRRHHNYVKVAKQYEQIYTKKSGETQ